TRTRFEPMAVNVEQALEISRPELIADAVRAISATRPTGYIYGCTSGSFVRGLAGERGMVEAMQSAGREASAAAALAVDTAFGEPTAEPQSHEDPTAVTTSGALVEAVQALGGTK